MLLLPNSRQFPVDETCENIVRELQKRGFRVPGVNVTFYEYAGHQRVDKIEGDDFLLRFCREQGRIDERYVDCAAVTQINIPQRELHIFSDESGPRLHVYVGNSWPRDKRTFMHSAKVNSKLNREPRRYLTYLGDEQRTDEDGIGFHYRGKRPTYLVHNNDLGREYDLKAGDTSYFVTASVLDEFSEWLKNNVLARLVAG